MGYENNIFINCPFDEAYELLLRALVFAVQDCGFVARCALEFDDGSEGRIERIRRIIAESKFGIHDLSRTELDAAELPRFNMPLELGIFLGAKLFGGEEHRQKACAIFVRDKYRYQRFCSDIAGQDVRAHDGEVREMIHGVRNALRTWRPERQLAGGAVVYERYRRFSDSLPTLASRLLLDPDNLTFNDLTALVTAWLEAKDEDAGRAAGVSGAG